MIQGLRSAIYPVPDLAAAVAKIEQLRSRQFGDRLAWA